MLTLSPAANVVDSRSITVTATDPSSATDNETFQLTVNPPANPPSSGAVHGLRLNYIEFFGWGLPDEGRPFRAFRRKEIVGWKPSS